MGSLPFLQYGSLDHAEQTHSYLLYSCQLALLGHLDIFSCHPLGEVNPHPVSLHLLMEQVLLVRSFLILLYGNVDALSFILYLTVSVFTFFRNFTFSLLDFSAPPTPFNCRLSLLTLIYGAETSGTLMLRKKMSFLCTQVTLWVKLAVAAILNQVD